MSVHEAAILRSGARYGCRARVYEPWRALLFGFSTLLLFDQKEKTVISNDHLRRCDFEYGIKQGKKRRCFFYVHIYGSEQKDDAEIQSGGLYWATCTIQGCEIWLFCRLSFREYHDIV